jgi:hypothetical protein
MAARVSRISSAVWSSGRRDAVERPIKDLEPRHHVTATTIGSAIQGADLSPNVDDLQHVRCPGLHSVNRATRIPTHEREFLRHITGRLSCGAELFDETGPTVADDHL